MDPLHDGTIFRLDKTALDRIRSPPQRTSPAVKPSAAVRISEPIVGIREQFEDLYRSTPNPLIALTSKGLMRTIANLTNRSLSIYSGQHARTGIQHISGCREDSFNDDVLSECDEDEEQLRKARPVEKRVISTNNPDQKPSDKIASVLAPTNSIRKEEIHSSNSDASDRESIAESSSDKSVDDAVEGLAESIAKSPSQKKSRHSTPAHSLSETIRSAGLDEYIMSKKTPLLPPRDRYGTGRTPRSDIVRGSKIFGSSPSSVTPRSNLATGRLHKRQVQSDVKSDGSRALSVEAPSRKRGHGKNDSLSFLNQLTQTKGAASPAVSILRKNSEPVEKTQLENDTRSSTSSQERKTSSRALAQESRKQTVSRSSAPAKVSHDCYNPQHTLFPSNAVFGVERDALRVKRQRGQKSIPSSPDGEENDTFSMKKKRAKKAVLMLIANEVRRSDDKSTAGAIASVTSRNLHVGAGRGNRRSNVDGLLGLGRYDGQLISDRTRSRVRESLSPVEQQSDRDNIGVTDGSASAREGVKKTTSKKQKEKTVNKSVVPNIVKSPTSDMTFSDGRSSQDTYTSSTAIWSAVEIKALRTAHKLCPITAPDFWEQVAAEVNRIVSNEYKKYGHKEGLQRSSDDCQLQWFKVSVCNNICQCVMELCQPAGVAEERKCNCSSDQIESKEADKQRQANCRSTTTL